jgi:ketosteroid isomerase-like protein
MVRMGEAESERRAAREELVRRTNERWNAGHREIREQDADPECEIRSALTGSVHHGYDGVRSWMREIDEQFDTWRTQLDEFADATEDRLLVLGSIHFRGRGSGIELEVPISWLFEFRNGRILRMTTFATHDEGRRAAGVS